MFEERRYLIFNMSEINKIDFTQVLETSTETLRKSVDETKSFIKWENVIPDFIGSLTTKEGPYTHSEILMILSGEVWTETIIEIEIEEI